MSLKTKIKLRFLVGSMLATPLSATALCLFYYWLIMKKFSVFPTMYYTQKAFSEHGFDKIWWHHFENNILSIWWWFLVALVIDYFWNKVLNKGLSKIA